MNKLVHNFEKLSAGQLIHVDIAPSKNNKYSLYGKRWAIVLKPSPSTSATVQIVPLSNTFKLKWAQEICKIKLEDNFYHIKDSYLRFDSIMAVEKIRITNVYHRNYEVYNEVYRKTKERLERYMEIK